MYISHIFILCANHSFTDCDIGLNWSKKNFEKTRMTYTVVDLAQFWRI